MTERRPYTAVSAAEYLGCSPSHIRNLCNRGELRHFFIGRLLRIPAAAIEELECGSSGSEAPITPTGETPESPAAPPFELRIVKSPADG